MATLTTGDGYLIYTIEGRIIEIPYSLLSICTIVKYTEKVSIILPSETNTHQKSFVDIYPTSALTTVDAVEAYIKSAQAEASGISGASTAIADYKLSASVYSVSSIQIEKPSSLTILNSSQIVYVKQVEGNNESVTYVNGAGGYTLVFDGINNITLYKNGAEYDGFSEDGTSSWEVGINSNISLNDTVGNSPMPLAPNYVSPYDFSVAYTSEVTLTCSGSPFDIDSSICNLVSLVVTRANGSVTKYLHGNNGVSLSAVGNVVTITGAGTTPFLNTDTKYRLGVNYQQKGYDPTTDTNKGFMSNYPVQPLHNVLIAPSTSVIADSWFPSKDGIDVGVHKTHTFTGILAPATSQILTITLEGTNADDLTVDANWTALDFFNVASLAVVKTLATSAGTSTPFNLRITDCGYRNIRFRLTPTVNTNANTCNAYLNSIY